jgi:hypothetical protein
LPSAPAKASRSTLLWLVLLGAAAALLLDIALHKILYFALQRQDQTWLLYAASRVLSGTQLYGPRLVETNPPLIIWLNIIPAWLAIHLHLQPLVVLDSLVTLLLVLSSAWSIRILRIAGVLRGRTASFVAFVFIFAAPTVILRNFDFSEREHILLLLLLPYLIASFFQLANTITLAERIALGLAAGLAASIKPQYAIIPLGTELFLALWYRQARRLYRPELLTLSLTGLAYIAAVRTITPLYFSQIVPLLRDAYPAYRGNHPILWVMLHEIPYDLIFSVTLLVWITTRRKLRYAVAPIGLLAASFFATIAFGIQRTGWPYQTVPRNALLLAAIFWITAELTASTIARLQPDKHFRLLITITLLLVLLPNTLFSLKRLKYGRSTGHPTLEQRVYASLPPGTTVYVLSTNFYNFSDVLHDHLLWGGRYNHLWMLPAIVLNEGTTGTPPAAIALPPARTQQLATLLRSNVADDIHTFAPAVIFVEHCNPTTHPCFALENLTFDTLAWFQRSPAFAAQWHNYHLQQSAEDFDVYARSESSSH